jgi:radical SAM superfamily enzyme YgiQ (UPF0313 family)
MKILLVRLYLSPSTLTGRSYLEFEPLELEYLAAELHDHDVELLDMSFDKDFEGRMTTFQPDIVACTAYSVHVYNVRRILQTAKRFREDVFTVVGGHHATLMPHDFQCREVDAIVIGEGLYTFRDLVEAIEKRLPLGYVPGICYREGQQYVFTDPRDDIDNFEFFPLPDRQITQKYRNRYFYLWWKPAALVRGSIGCAYRCSFCPIWKAAGGKLKFRSPQSVADELATLNENFVYFCDDNAFFDSQRIETLYQLLNERNIRKEYFFFSRPEELVKRPDLVEKWADIGLRQVFLGVEAVDPEDLRPLRKRMDSQTNKASIHLLKKNGIDPIAAFITLPEYSKKDFDRIYDYMEDLGIYYSEFSILTPLPGSDLYCEKKDQILTENYELFDNLHPVLPTQLKPRDFCRHLARLWIKVYSPLRAVRIKPMVKPPLSLGRIPRELMTALKNYRAIKNGYKTMRRRRASPRSY